MWRPVRQVIRLALMGNVADAEASWVCPGGPGGALVVGKPRPFLLLLSGKMFIGFDFLLQKLTKTKVVSCINDQLPSIHPNMIQSKASSRVTS